jgi:hypothetical protein
VSAARAEPKGTPDQGDKSGGSQSELEVSVFLEHGGKDTEGHKQLEWVDWPRRWTQVRHFSLNVVAFWRRFNHEHHLRTSTLIAGPVSRGVPHAAEGIGQLVPEVLSVFNA